MKPYQSILGTLVILQVTVVILLSAITILSYRGQADVHQLRDDIATMKAEWTTEAESSLADRVSALEARLGMRDPEADQTAAALQQQMARADLLGERFHQLQDARSNGPAKTPPPPPTPKPEPIPQPELIAGPEPNPPLAVPDGLTPAERANAKLPVIGKVQAFDADWQYCTIDKGRLDGIRAGQEFAVHSKDSHDLLATVKISRLEPHSAIADLVPGTWSAGSPAPAFGDLLIDTSKQK